MSRGHDRERQVRVLLEADGYVTLRAAGSLGPVDVVAMRAARPAEGWVGKLVEEKPRVLLIEVKSTHRGPFHSFGPADRAELVDLAERAGGEAVLCWWPPRARAKFIPSSEWPEGRVAA